MGTASSSDTDWQGQQHLDIVTASLGCQLQAAMQHFDFLLPGSSASAGTQQAMDALNHSFQALRRAKALIGVLDESLPQMH